MAKILTDKDLAQIVTNACTREDVIEDLDSYLYFLEDLGALIARHFGGTRGDVFYSDKADQYLIRFEANASVPYDGGVYKHYDPSEVWKGRKDL